MGRPARHSKVADLVVQAIDHMGQERERDGLDHADAKFRNIAFAETADAVADLFQFNEKLASAQAQIVTGGRDLLRTHTAVDEKNTEIALQLRKVLRDRGLGKIELAGC